MTFRARICICTSQTASLELNADNMSSGRLIGIYWPFPMTDQSESDTSNLLGNRISYQPECEASHVFQIPKKNNDSNFRALERCFERGFSFDVWHFPINPFQAIRRSSSHRPEIIFCLISRNRRQISVFDYTRSLKIYTNKKVKRRALEIGP